MREALLLLQSLLKVHTFQRLCSFRFPPLVMKDVRQGLGKSAATPFCGYGLGLYCYTVLNRIPCTIQVCNISTCTQMPGVCCEFFSEPKLKPGAPRKRHISVLVASFQYSLAG